MKKCITILVAILLFINSGGFIIIFYQAQKSAKQEILCSIKDGKYKIRDIAQFRIDRTDIYRNINGFIWNDKNEFEYKGELYDIINLSAENNSLILFCINDITEEQIVKTFNNEINGLARGDLNNSKVKTSLLNLISQALIKNPADINQYYNYQPFNLIADENIILAYREIPSPPPKIL